MGQRKWLCEGSKLQLGKTLNAISVMFGAQGIEKGFTMKNACSAPSAQITHRETYIIKWAIPATLLEYQGQGRIIFPTWRCLSKQGYKHNHNSSICRHFYNHGCTWVTQVAPSQAATLGRWPAGSGSEVSCCPMGELVVDELVYGIRFRPNYKQPCRHFDQCEEQINSITSELPANNIDTFLQLHQD